MQPKVDQVIAAIDAKLGSGYSSGYSNSYADSSTVEIVITDSLTGAATYIYVDSAASIEDILNTAPDDDYSIEGAIEQLRNADKGAHTLETLARLLPEGITVKQSFWGDAWWATYEFTNAATGAVCHADFDLDPEVENSAELPVIAAAAAAALA